MNGACCGREIAGSEVSCAESVDGGVLMVGVGVREGEVVSETVSEANVYFVGIHAYQKV